MTNVTDEPGTTEDTGAELEMEGFEEAFENSPQGWENLTEGQAPEAEAVEPTPDEETRPDDAEIVEPEAETDETEEVVESEATETPDDDAEPEEPKEAVEVNFDGLSDDSRKFWENALKEGHATSDDVERARIESMFQSSYTKKTMALADQRREFESRKEDLELLDKIRGDDNLHRAWLRMAEGDHTSEDATGDDDELVSAKDARRMAQEEAKRLLEEGQKKTAAQQQQYESKRGEVQEVIQASMKAMGIDAETMQGYLSTIEGDLPEGADPIMSVDPMDLQRRVLQQHEFAKAQQRIADLEGKLTQKTAKAARTAKQSQPPARQVADGGVQTPLQKTESDLGLDPDWSNVQGWGFRNQK